MLHSKLLTLLATHNISLKEWGVGEAKTVEFLLAEINAGESVMDFQGECVLRVVQNAGVSVFYTDGARAWKLIEKKQIFKDGRERIRELETSLGEKMKLNEEPETAAYRALSEELKITERVPLARLPPIVKGPIASRSYPGLLTVYRTYAFEVWLPTHLYKSEGYIEHQPDKDSYFVWRQLSQ